jgi:hypothetical protein
MGTLLNEKLGPPTERQPRGQQVIKQVAVQLRIAESDLSRMRWLAHRFTSIDELRQQHPEVGTWTQFKELLPDLQEREAPSQDVQSGSMPSAPRTTPMRQVRRPLVSLAKTIETHAQALRGTEETHILMEELKSLAKVLEDQLHIRLTVTLHRQPAATVADGE